MTLASRQTLRIRRYETIFPNMKKDPQKNLRALRDAKSCIWLESQAGLGFDLLRQNL